MNHKRKEASKVDLEKPVNRARHEKYCKVCLHSERETIEQDWIDWGSTSRIAKQYRISRDSLYRHAHAARLFPKRQKNIRRALERIIEQAETVQVTAPAVVSAIQAYAKINARGHWIERVEGVDLSMLFDKMTRDELEAYAGSGKLPDWFLRETGATHSDDC